MQGSPFFGEQKTEQCFNNVQQAIAAVIDTLPTPSQAGSAIFSSTCSSHCTTSGADFWTISVNGESMAQQFASWWFGHNAGNVVSECRGYQCMAECVPMESKFPQGFGATENIA